MRRVQLTILINLRTQSRMTILLLVCTGFQANHFNSGLRSLKPQMDLIDKETKAKLAAYSGNLLNNFNIYIIIYK